MTSHDWEWGVAGWNEYGCTLNFQCDQDDVKYFVMDKCLKDAYLLVLAHDAFIIIDHISFGDCTPATQIHFHFFFIKSIIISKSLNAKDPELFEAKLDVYCWIPSPTITTAL